MPFQGFWILDGFRSTIAIEDPEPSASHLVAAMSYRVSDGIRAAKSGASFLLDLFKKRIWLGVS